MAADAASPAGAQGAQPATPEQGGDLSSRTILALVILTIAVSFVGAFFTLSQAMAPDASPAAAPHATTAQVGFVIEPPARTTGTSTGMVTLGIERPPR